MDDLDVVIRLSEDFPWFWVDEWCKSDRQQLPDRRWHSEVKRFKVEWEMPEMGPEGENVQRFYQSDGGTPLPASDWPSEQEVPWAMTSRESEDIGGIIDQFGGLTEAVSAGHPIRNVKVYQSQITWTPYPINSPAHQ